LFASVPPRSPIPLPPSDPPLASTNVLASNAFNNQRRNGEEDGIRCKEEAP
jgi:hypothetical protein